MTTDHTDETDEPTVDGHVDPDAEFDTDGTGSRGLPSSVVTFGAIAGLLIAALGGFLGGSALAERHSQPGTETVTVADPRSAAPTTNILRSPAGFTGFEAGALGGSVTRAGQTTEASTTGTSGLTFAIADGPAAMTVQATASTRLYRLQPATTPLAAADVIVIRIDESRAPLAILRVPADLREGDAR